MPSIEELRSRSDALFRAPDNGLPVSPDPDLPVDVRHGAERLRRFSVFNAAHEETALRLVDRLMEPLDRGAGSEASLGEALDRAEAAAKTQNSELVKFALSVFITHHPAARPLHVPPIQEIKPLMLLPSHPGVPPNDVVAQGGLGPEARMDYFREANHYNEHHEKWHRVFPWAGSRVPGRPGAPKPKDRQGELFWYMHEQMLARYDTDRLARDLPPVVAFSDYQAKVGEGYDVEPGQQQLGYASRPPNQRWGDLPEYTVADHEAVRDSIKAAIAAQAFQVDGHKVPITPDLMGAVLESSLGARADLGAGLVDLRQTFGSLHNLGHAFFANLSKGGDGVMSNTSAAVRDPVFYRWHRHIDDLFVQWQETLDPYDFAAGIPPVRLRKHADGESTDIGLALLAQMPGAPANGAEFDGTSFGKEQFSGDASWPRPFSDFTGPGKPLTDTLLTRIATETIELPNGNRFEKFILDHDEFAYFLRLENLSDAEQRVTVRIFLAAADKSTDRRWWIEMDKFLYTLGEREKAVVYRPARFSSVVRKPAFRPSEVGEAASDDLCDCGWPYHMLLPRGTEGDGMPFRLCVVLTDAEQDLLGSEKRCSSVSFCGARDSRYPDRKEMGYPFNRPFKRLSIADTFALDLHPHIGGRTLRIRHMG